FVVVVGDVGDVRNARVADVPVAEIIPACAVRRQIRFAITQREPSHCGTSTYRQADAPVSTANPGDESRRVHGPNCHGSRYPAPISGVVHPSTVVAGRESPGSIVNPRPTPRLDPGPMAIVIRSPSRRDS